MILDMVFNVFYFLFNMFVSLIPTINIDLDLSSYVVPVADAIGYIDTFVSLNVLALSIGTIILVNNFTFIIRLIMKLWQMLPFT